MKRWPRRSPLPLAGDARRVPPDPPPGPVDIIVAVYGAPEELGRCLRSLTAHTDLARHRLVLVLDGPQPPAVGAALREALGGAAGEAPGAAVGDVSGAALVIRQAERRGFVESVNRGMAESARDVVLLNSDTQVTAGWLDKLQRAAYSAPEIASATPFSNSATICSLPRSLESNALPAGWDVAAFGRLVEERALPAYPRLPTGVGVCLYLKRKALAQLGPFDSRTFGLGYGEESEFCMRALKAGYAHVLDDATFVFHEGHRSFGASRRGRVAAAHRLLARRHPEYLATVASFLRDDPLRPLRDRVVAALAPRRRAGPPGAPERVLHVVHGWPPWNYAGTEMVAAWLARRQAEHREVTAFSRIADPARGLGDAVELLDGGVRVRLLVRNFDERDPRSRNALASRPVERDFERLLTAARPQIVHVHHLAGHAASLAAVARRRGIPLVYQLNDWWTPCARANLLDRERRQCSGPAPGKCAACLPLTGLPPAPLLNRLLYRYRAAATGSALRAAAAYVTGSRFLRDSYLELGLLAPGDTVHVVPYGVELTAPAPRAERRPGAPLRFGVIGSILPHKGIHVAVAAFAGMDPRQARLTVWGDPEVAPAYARELAGLGAAVIADGGGGGSGADGGAGGSGVNGGGEIDRGARGAAGGGESGPGRGAVTLAGRFEEARKAEIFAGLDVLIVPSLGLESYGLVAYEALHHGVPVLASRRGALVEIFAGSVAGGGAAAADALVEAGNHAAAGYAVGAAGDAAAGDGDGAGALFAAGDSAALRRWVDRLVAEPGLLATWSRRLPAVKGAGEYAEEIEEIYRRVLADAAAGRREAGR